MCLWTEIMFSLFSNRDKINNLFHFVRIGILNFLTLALISSCSDKASPAAEILSTGWFYEINESCVIVIDQPATFMGNIFQYTKTNCPVHLENKPISTMPEIIKKVESTLYSGSYADFFSGLENLTYDEPFAMYLENGSISWLIPVRNAGKIAWIIEIDDKSLEILSLRNAPDRLFLINEIEARRLVSKKFEMDLSLFPIGRYVTYSTSQK